MNDTIRCALLMGGTIIGDQALALAEALHEAGWDKAWDAHEDPMRIHPTLRFISDHANFSTMGGEGIPCPYDLRPRAA